MKILCKRCTRRIGPDQKPKSKHVQIVVTEQGNVWGYLFDTKTFAFCKLII